MNGNIETAHDMYRMPRSTSFGAPSPRTAATSGHSRTPGRERRVGVERARIQPVDQEETEGHRIRGLRLSEWGGSPTRGCRTDRPLAAGGQLLTAIPQR